MLFFFKSSPCPPAVPDISILSPFFFTKPTLMNLALALLLLLLSFCWNYRQLQFDEEEDVEDGLSWVGLVVRTGAAHHHHHVNLRCCQEWEEEQGKVSYYYFFSHRLFLILGDS